LGKRTGPRGLDEGACSRNRGEGAVFLVRVWVTVPVPVAWVPLGTAAGPCWAGQRPRDLPCRRLRTLFHHADARVTTYHACSPKQSPARSGCWAHAHP